MRRDDAVDADELIAGGAPLLRRARARLQRLRARRRGGDEDLVAAPRRTPASTSSTRCRRWSASTGSRSDQLADGSRGQAGRPSTDQVDDYWELMASAYMSLALPPGGLRPLRPTTRDCWPTTSPPSSGYLDGRAGERSDDDRQRRGRRHLLGRHARRRRVARGSPGRPPRQRPTPASTSGRELASLQASHMGEPIYAADGLRDALPLPPVHGPAALGLPGFLAHD